MSLVADVLLLLTSFSLRTQFVSKAVAYGQAGTRLFPDDQRLREVYAFALFLDGQTEAAAQAIAPARVDTPNATFLKARLALTGARSDPERAAAVRSHLRPESTA